MLHNLEGISFEEVTDSKGTSYAVFRSQLRPDYARAWGDIGKGYFFLLAASAGFIWLDHEFHHLWWAFVLPFALLIGYIAAYLALFIHEVLPQDPLATPPAPGHPAGYGDILFQPAYQTIRS